MCLCGFRASPAIIIPGALAAETYAEAGAASKLGSDGAERLQPAVLLADLAAEAGLRRRCTLRCAHRRGARRPGAWHWNRWRCILAGAA